MNMQDVEVLRQCTFPAQHQIEKNGYVCAMNYVYHKKFKRGRWELVVYPDGCHVVEDEGGNLFLDLTEEDDEDWDDVWDHEDEVEVGAERMRHSSRCIKHCLSYKQSQLQSTSYATMFKALERTWATVLTAVRQLEEVWVE